MLFALAVVGGLGAGLQRARDVPATFTTFTGPPGHWLSTLVLLVPAFIVSPGLVQKAYGAESARAVRIGVGVNAVGLLLFAICPAVLGMVARVLHPDLPHADLALPTLLAVDLPPIDRRAHAGRRARGRDQRRPTPCLFMLSTSSSQDLYRRFIAPEATDTQVLRVARLAAVVAGIAGVGHGDRDPHGRRRAEDLLRRRHGDAVRAGRRVAAHARAAGNPKAWSRWAWAWRHGLRSPSASRARRLAGLPAPACGLVASALGLPR